MNILDIRSICLAIMMLAFTASAGATTVTYQVNQSNKFQDGTDYLSVDVSDDIAGQLNFDVDILPALSAYAGSGFGMQRFGFNLFGATPARINVIGLPGWSVDIDQKMGVVGTRQVTLSGNRNFRETSLSFAVLGLTLADIDSDFAVVIGGIDTQLDVCDGNVCENIHRAIVYADAGIASVPVPAAAWLFVSGLIGLLSLGRRRG